jgi:hypothetical protein
LTRLDDAIILLHEDVEFVIWARKIVESAFGCSFAALPPISIRPPPAQMVYARAFERYQQSQ